MTSLKNKVVLITGASSGIGAGAAIHLAGLGCRLALNGRNENNLKSVAAKCISLGLQKENVFPIVAPLDEVSGCERIVNETIKHFGQLDVLVNNAGIVVLGGLRDLSVEDFDKQMNVNMRSVFILSKLAIPHLLKVKGNIVNVSSLGSMRSFPEVVAYCMSKSALDQLTRCTALELAGHGVRVNSVNPGMVDTEIAKRAGIPEEHYKQLLENNSKTEPLGRTGTVEDVAKAIAFLASDDASFITGETLPVVGGRLAMCPR